MKKHSLLSALTIAALAAATLVVTSAAAEVPAPLTKSDDKPADQTKKVKVFILMGQSNMVGMGDIEPADKPGTLTTLTKTEKKYPHLLDDAGQWIARKDVYYYDARREAEVSPKNQGCHYNRNAETYYEVGNALGWAMAELLQAKKQEHRR